MIVRGMPGRAFCAETRSRGLPVLALHDRHNHGEAARQAHVCASRSFGRSLEKLSGVLRHARTKALTSPATASSWTKHNKALEGIRQGAYPWFGHNKWAWNKCGLVYADSLTEPNLYTPATHTPRS